MIRLIFLLITALSFTWAAAEPSLEHFLLPKDHPLQSSLKWLFPDRAMFDSIENLIERGFVSKWQQHNVRPNTIFVISHDSIPGYLIKKHANTISRSSQLACYLRRLVGAEAVDQYIKQNQLKHIIVPKKWLYRLPSRFNDPFTGEADYLLIVEEIEICLGGWWGGENLERYRQIKKPVLTELCKLLYDLRGCDAWPQNQPFTPGGKIAFIDTEHLGSTYGDFLKTTVHYIDPNLVNFGMIFWSQLAKFSSSCEETRPLRAGSFKTEDWAEFEARSNWQSQALRPGCSAAHKLN